MSPRVFIYEGEAERLGRWTEAFRRLETGGELFGQYLPTGAFVVHLVTGPGPQARRTSTSFHQDADYMRAIGHAVFARHALQHGGSWHSHHALSLAEPSEGDSATIVRAIETMGLASMLLVIANLSDRRGRPSRHGSPTARAFLYTPARRDDYVPAAWTVLPGESPVRRDRRLSALLPEPEITTSDVRLTPRYQDAPARTLRPGCWALGPSGAWLLAYAKERLEAIGGVRMLPSERGLLEMHVAAPDDVAIVTFDHETTLTHCRAWLSRRGAAHAPPRIAVGTFESVIDELAHLIAPPPASTRGVAPRPARPVAEVRYVPSLFGARIRALRPRFDRLSATRPRRVISACT